MALHRTAVASCAALVALLLAAALLVRGGGGPGAFHVFETAATPTVEIAGLPAPSLPAATAERADLERLARTTMVLLLAAGVAVLATLVGVVGSENLALRGRRVIEVMLGAPPGRLVGAVVRIWRRRLLVATALGGGLCVAAAAWLASGAPARTGLEAPALWPAVAALVFVVAVVIGAGVVPVQRLYARGRSLSEEADRRQHTDPRPQQFNRVLIIMGQIAVSVALLGASGLMVQSASARPDLGGDAGEAGWTVLGRLAIVADSADSTGRSAVYEAALDALRDAPGLAAASLSTPGAWLGRGPEAVAVNECGPCMAGGMPNPVHRTRVQVHAVMPGFFASRGMRFVAGGGFGRGAPGLDRAPPQGDAGAGPRSVVINEAYARAHFIDPVGRTLTLRGAAEEVWYDVVGVVADAPRGGLGASGSWFAVYHSALEHPPSALELVALAAVSGPAGLDDSLRAVRRALDSVPQGELEVLDFGSAADELARVYGTAGWLGGGARAAGVLAAVVALAGVTSTLRAHVRSRLREMGVRSALGAPPRALRRMVLAEAVRLAAVGTGLGLWAATFLVAVLSPVAVEIFNPPLFLGVALLFVGAAFAVALPGAGLAASADPRSVMEA